MILIAVQCSLFKTKVVNTLIAKKYYHIVYFRVTLQYTEEHSLLEQSMGTLHSAEMLLISYKLHIVMSHKPLVFIVADLRTSSFTHCKVRDCRGIHNKIGSVHIM
jgi:hypothetical protein